MKDLSSIATHDIAAPLTVIKGYISMMKGGDITTKSLDIIERSTEKLIHIVHNFIDAYRIDEKEVVYEFQDTDLNTLLQQIGAEFKISFKKVKEIILSLDADKITQAIRTILNNSMRYASTGDVRMHLDIKGETATIRITDTGVRNFPNVHKKLVEKFSHSSNQNEANIMSKDLALYIAKKTIEAHKGLFSINQIRESENKFLTEFSLLLPLK